GGDVHHHAGLARDHRGQAAAGQLDQHLDVEADLVQLTVDRQAVEAADRPEAGVVHEPVDGEPPAAEVVQQLARRAGLDQVLGDHVGGHSVHVRQLARQGFQPVAAPGNQYEMPAVTREAAGERLADSARGAGDERDLLRHGITSGGLGGPAYHDATAVDSLRP